MQPAEAPKKTRKPMRKFKLETRADVITYMTETVRSLRKLHVSDEKLDPIRITKLKTIIYALSKTAELMNQEALIQVSDDALASEVRRRAQLAGVIKPAAQARAPETH